MAFGNFWRGSGRERFGEDRERDRDRNRDRWRTGEARDEGRDRWRNDERYGAAEQDSREYGSRHGRDYGSSESPPGGEYYGERPRSYGSEGYGSSGYRNEIYRGQQDFGAEATRSGARDEGRGWDEYANRYSGRQYGAGEGNEYDYRGGSLGGGFGESQRDSGRFGGYGPSDYGQRSSQGFGSSRYVSQSAQSEGQHRGRGPRGYRRSDDRIREDVCDCLTDDPYIDASNLEVTVKDCEVTLSGTVVRREDKRRAEDLAERISGVKDVRNNLRVASEQGGERIGAQSATGQTSGQGASQRTASSESQKAAGGESQKGTGGESSRH